MKQIYNMPKWRVIIWAMVMCVVAAFYTFHTSSHTTKYRPDAVLMPLTKSTEMLKPNKSVVTAPKTWTISMPLPTVDTKSGRRMPAIQPEIDSNEWKSSPVDLKGQVTMQTSFGKELNRVARQSDVHLVLEIGTWFGGGSSWCIAQGLKTSGNGKWLITMELIDEAWDYASKTLQRLPVTCMKAGTVGMEGYLKPDQMTAEDRASEHYRLYYDRDIAVAKQTTPMLETLCKTYDFDLVLIDGNEYTGSAEFEIVSRQCRPRYLALHDTGTLKTRRVEVILGTSNKWKKISSGMDAAGWAVYKSVQ